jgi:hypothetical protein
MACYTGLVCVVYGGRDFDPISSSWQPCMEGWTCDPISSHIVTIPSEPIAGAKHFLLGENCILCPLLLKCTVSVIVMSVTEYHIRGSPELLRYVHNVISSVGRVTDILYTRGPRELLTYGSTVK